MKEVTEEQVAKWKAEYGDVFRLESDDNKYVCYLRKPTRQELGLAAKKSQSNPMAFNAVILQSCWLGGNEEMRQKDEYYYGVSQALEEIIGTVQAAVKKL